ncbi:fibrillin-1-like [Neocloeon triangulifer]|uniref:fibrillin-1-like n=1 Tax=Neocloeon triangulifer TaxID=2078957 RepID=UPI00286F055A|nr:fibrillin-1-like [Neocloeon triangulifer]
MLRALSAFVLLVYSLETSRAAVGDLETTLRHCCNLGRQESRCSNIVAPKDVPQEHLSMCLTAIEICCVEADRAKECSLGQEDAKAKQDCIILPGTTGRYRRDCCSACKLGMIVSSMGMTCASQEFLFGSPWNVAYMTCCSGIPYTGRAVHEPPRSPLLSNVGGNFPTQNHLDDSEEADDLCDQFPGQLCQDICIPTEGSYVCACKTGFTLDADGKSCTILPQNDRCRSNNPCSQKCVDTGVSIACSCLPGYVLAPDKKNCQDINECTSEDNVCKLAGMQCRNEVGSFVCLTPDGSVMQPGTLQSQAGHDEHIKESVTQTSVDNEATTKCPPGYVVNQTTHYCDDLNECVLSKNICGLNTTCVNTVGSYFCEDAPPEVVCSPGLRFNSESGKCEDVDECLEELDNCREKNEKCLNTMGSYICHRPASRRCPAGFKYDISLRQCLDVDECSEKIDSCNREQEQCVNTNGAFECITDQRPFTAWTPVTPTPRQTIVTSPSVPVYSVPAQNCQQGFQFDVNLRRCIDIDECSERNAPVCDGAQDCVNSPGSYTCVCKRGFQQDPSTLACVDINECQLDTHDCTVGQRCDNTIGSYKCFRLTSCGTGYTLNANTGSCEDDNECLLRTDNCAELGPRYQCRNTVGSFRCVPKICEGKKILSASGQCVDQACPSGFEPSLLGKCVDIDECRQNACRENEKCINTQGSYYCTRKLDCGPGFEMNEHGNQCLDIDECAKGTHQCASGQQCFNRQGSYACQCPPGYQINQFTKQCVDIDECTSLRGNFQLCSANSICQNTPGAYRCNCKEGFRHENDDYKVCHDINECDSGPGLCQHTCLNNWGSFRCACNPGFTLQSDGRSCFDIDECSEFKDRNLCVGICQNTPGSYKCRCPEGYKLGSDERTCIDIDECSANSGVCRSDQVCLNTRGSYQCNNVYCPPNYSRETDHKNRCKKNSFYCRDGDAECMKEPQTISNNYMTFVSNIGIPSIGYLDLFTMRGPMWQSTAVRFDLQLANARAPQHVPTVTKDFFRIRRQSHNQAIISMVRSIKGPQQIELHLTMDILHNGVFSGTVLAKLFIVVSEHEF